jgi:hypothetical protein
MNARCYWLTSEVKALTYGEKFPLEPREATRPISEIVPFRTERVCRVATATYGIRQILRKRVGGSRPPAILLLSFLAATINLFLLFLLTAAGAKAVQHESNLWEFVAVIVGLFTYWVSQGFVLRRMTVVVLPWNWPRTAWHSNVAAFGSL